MSTTSASSTQTRTRINEGLLTFLDASPTPFHAVEQMAAMLEQAGFIALSEQDNWQLQPYGNYYCIRNSSAIIAWRMGDSDISNYGIRLVGAHTDSPCLKVKPNPERNEHHCLRLGVEVYGGAILHTWFDRDLTLAGRVVFMDSQQKMHTVLVNFEKAIARIPNLAIHLNRTVNSNHSINSQLHLPLVLAANSSPDGYINKDLKLRDLLKQQIQKQYPQSDCASVLEYELNVADTQPASISGLHDDFINSPRLDNLLSCYIGLQALLDSPSQHCQLLICTDHEEVGSQSQVGAKGSMLSDILQRIEPDSHRRQRAISRSLLISADNAHALHPNYPEVHDAQHGPQINAGPVIKLNSNQSYASNSIGTSWVKYFGLKAQVPLQQFVVRSDMGCGSTIGPISAAQLGINTVDIGAPQWAMHSIRETSGSADSQYLYQLLCQHYVHEGDFSVPQTHVSSSKKPQ